MLKEVRSEGACATWDGEELAIKRTNDFNDQYDILTFENFHPARQRLLSRHLLPRLVLTPGKRFLTRAPPAA